MSNCYTAFGLCLHSDLELVPLQACQDAAINLPVIRIEQGEVSNTGLKNTQSSLVYCDVVANTVWLRIPNVARFLIENGDHVTYEAERIIASFDDEDGRMVSNEVQLVQIALYIQSHCVPYICLQRGHLVLRGSAVRFGEQCAVFCGPASSGKTTYAAALYNRGFDVISDEVCVFNEHNEVLAGYTYLKVWHDVLSYLRLEPTDFSPLFPGINKYVFPLEAAQATTALPVSAIYLLYQDYIKEWHTKPVRGLGKLNYLKSPSHAYRPGVRSKLGLPDLIVQQTRLMQAVSIIKTKRPKSIRAIRMSQQLQFFIDDMGLGVDD